MTALSELIVVVTQSQIYRVALAVANAAGLPVTSWQAGDPMRTLLNAQAEAMASRDANEAGYIASGFLDYAEGEWLKQHAAQQFGVTVPAAVAATTDVVISNPGGGFYPDIEVRALTFRNTVTGKTYSNTTGGTLASGPGTTLTVTVVADEAGSDSSAGAGEIDFLVTPLGASTCSNAVAAIGVDEQSEETTREQCRARRGRATPNGPKDAYTDVALDPLLTGTYGITGARAYADSDVGDVTVYLRAPSGAVSEANRALVETAILVNATPLCITPTVLSCTAVTVAVTYSMNLYKRSNLTATEAAALVSAALASLFAVRPIGGDIVSPDTTGKIYASQILSTIKGVSSDAFRVTVSLPAGDTSLTNGQVAALGTVTPTITIEKDPT